MAALTRHKSYAELYLELWNNGGVIFGRALSGKDWRLVTTPRGISGSSFGSIICYTKIIECVCCLTLMKSGRYPISGYTEGKIRLLWKAARLLLFGRKFNDYESADGTSYANTNTMYMGPGTEILQ